MQHWPAVLCVLLASPWHLGAPVSAQERPPAGISLDTGASAIHPGAVVAVTLQASVPLESVEGELFGRPVHFWNHGDRLEWRALAGVDVDAAPAAYTLTARAWTVEGGLLHASASLLVEPKDFEVRRLRVAARFVNPPAAAMARIEREAVLLAETYARAASERLWNDAFALPVPGRATSSFGRLSILNGEPRGRHRGADFRAAVGDPVRAPGAGLVLLARDLYFTGQTVVVDHGAGVVSVFAHLSKILVEEGALLERGALMGSAGATGRVTGPHLHWSVRLNEASVDPISLIATSAAIARD